MKTSSRNLAVGAVIVLALGSCDDRDRTPVGPAPGQPPVPPAVTTLRLELVAPPQIAPGETVQLVLNAIKSDGSVENVSSKATWSPLNSSILQVTASGLATGKDHGAVTVAVAFDRRSVYRAVMVLPTDTFRLTGTIRESGLGIENVTVTVIGGVGEGLTAISNTAGGFQLYGVRGAVSLQLKKEGYLNGLQQLDVSAHRNADFDMVAERPRRDYRGSYTLTFTAACSGSTRALPESVRRRAYSADVTQDGARLTVTLGDADFVLTNGFGNRFDGYVDLNDRVTFTIGDAYYYYYASSFDIVERITSASALTISGRVSATGSATSIAGTMKGAMMLYPRTTPPFTASSSECYSISHPFEMIRR